MQARHRAAMPVAWRDGRGVEQPPGAPVEGPADFLRVVVLAPKGWLFEAWLMLGALLAAPVFASSVVALPLLLDRQVSVLGAVLTSWRVVMTHPAPLALWAAAKLPETLHPEDRRPVSLRAIGAVGVALPHGGRLRRQMRGNARDQAACALSPGEGAGGWSVRPIVDGITSSPSSRKRMGSFSMPPLLTQDMAKPKAAARTRGK